MEVFLLMAVVITLGVPCFLLLLLAIGIVISC